MILAGKTDVHDWQPNLNLTINTLSRYFAVLKAHEEVKCNFDFKKKFSWSNLPPFPNLFLEFRNTGELWNAISESPWATGRRGVIQCDLDCHRRTDRGGRGGLQPPQILGNSDFLGNKRKFGQSLFLKTSPCLFNYSEDLNINLKSA